MATGSSHLDGILQGIPMASKFVLKPLFLLFYGQMERFDTPGDVRAGAEVRADFIASNAISLVSGYIKVSVLLMHKDVLVHRGFAISTNSGNQRQQCLVVLYLGTLEPVSLSLDLGSEARSQSH